MKIVGIVLLVCLAVVRSNGQLPEGFTITEEEGVMILTSENFDTEIETNRYMLVEFYAPWCGHCKTLAPEYAKAAQQLKEEGSEVKLGKVDATVQTSLAEKYGVQGYPTLKFFRDGKPTEYTGGRTADTIITWINKKLGGPTETLKTVDEAKAFIDSKKVVVIGFFKSLTTDAAKAFEKVAANVDDVAFAITDNVDIKAEYKIEKDDAVVLFKKFDEGRNDLDGKLTEETIREFILDHKLPLVVEFSIDSAPEIFGSKIKTHAIAFLRLDSPDFDEKKKLFEAAAKQDFKNRALFVYVDVGMEKIERILEFFKITKEDCPTFRVVQMVDNDMNKFKPENLEITTENVVSFVNGVIKGSVSQYFMSEEIPADWDKAPVKVLVGKNFKEVAFDKSKAVIVEFFAPWCDHCKKLAPIWDELGEAYKDNDEIVIAKMDLTANEVKEVKLNSIPSIIYYAKDSDKIVEFVGNRTLEAFKIFIDSKGKEGNVPPPTEPTEKPKEEPKEKKDEL